MHCCPACDSEETRWTGQIGTRMYAQCRDCGAEYSYIDEDEDEPERDEEEWDGQPDEAQEWHDFDPDC